MPNLFDIDNETTSSSFRCDKCPYAFNKSSHLIRHLEVHEKADLECPECGCGFKTKRRLTVHIKMFHQKVPSERSERGVVLIKLR